jgi:hypothetical protein
MKKVSVVLLAALVTMIVLVAPASPHLHPVP